MLNLTHRPLPAATTTQSGNANGGNGGDGVYNPTGQQADVVADKGGNGGNGGSVHQQSETSQSGQGNSGKAVWLHLLPALPGRSSVTCISIP